MKFKGTIVITDPCYVIKRDKEDDWSKCGYGENMEVLGINNYMTNNTIYGDWSCTVLETSDPKKAVDDIAEISKHFSNKLEECGGYNNITEEQTKALYEECDSMQDSLNLNLKKLGGFCADAGLVSVFLLDELVAYNSDFTKWAEDHYWCAAIIDDFDGDIEYYVDEMGDAHIIGTGSINFFTTQTGL